MWCGLLLFNVNSYINVSNPPFNKYSVYKKKASIPVRPNVILVIFTVRNVVAPRLCFHRWLSFCSQVGHVSQHALGRHPLDRHPLGRNPPAQCMLGYTPLPSACWDTHLPAQCMLGYTPLPSACWDTHLPAQCLLGYIPHPPSGHCSRWYASYWNAFLLPPAMKLQQGNVLCCFLCEQYM